MSLRILTNGGLGNKRQLSGGRFEFYGVAQWNGTDTTGQLLTGGLKYLDYVSNPTPIGAPANASGSEIILEPAVALAAISATTAFDLPPAPQAGVISAVNFVVHTTVATDAANIWTIGVVNKTQTFTIVDSTVAANSNNSTGGSAFTADTRRVLTLNVDPTKLVVAAGDIIEVTFTKAASAANLVELAFGAALTVVNTSENAIETIYLDESATVNTTSGEFTVPNVAGSYSIKISRTTVPTPTNNMNFFFRMQGRS